MPNEQKNCANMAYFLNEEVNQVTAAVNNCLATALPKGGKVVVGYSGGLDSAVLLGALRLCANDNITISAVHINHQLHQNALTWARHCQRRCRIWKVPLQIINVKLDSRPTGLEERARRARLAVFAATDADAVLLAHHADDQAETCLLRALRGSGVTGLAAMRQISRLPRSDKSLLRPLLGIRRSVLGRAAQNLRVRGVRDPSNYLLHFNRNWLRHVFLPEAEKRLPGPTFALNKLAANAAQTERLLNDLAAHDDQCCRSNGALQRGLLVAQGRLRVRNWLRWSLQQQKVVLSSGKHLSEAARQLCAARGTLTLSFGTVHLAVGKQRLNWQQLH